MEIDEEVVDLSVSSRRVPEMPVAPEMVSPRSSVVWPQRRSLRPRTDAPPSYAESPDVVIVSDEEPRTNGILNGNLESDDEDLPMPPLRAVKDLTEQEIQEREKTVRKLRDELRNEEMTLVLLKKLRQSHQLKENIAVVAPCPNQSPSQLPPHSKPLPAPRSSSKPPPPAPLNLLNRPGLTAARHVGPPVHPAPSLIGNRTIPPPGLPVSLHQAGNNLNRGGSNNLGVRNIGIGFSADRKDSRHSPVTITPTQERARIPEDSQTPAQRQAAAKLALRKQLEKTLLQIPPPKPPPPEMHFIPNPSNTEFIYLVGLEHVVDFITKDSRTPPPPEPFRCSQCSTNFTPVWKWEKSSSKGKDPRVICEQCVTWNVKKALKAEHTNRLKTAFVKALQQEQEIEERLAEGSPGPEPAASVVATQQQQPTTVLQQQTTPVQSQQPQPPPPPAPVQQGTVSQTQPLVKASTPKPPAPSSAGSVSASLSSPSQRDHLAKLADSTKFNPHHVAATLHQQLLRGLPQHQPLPAHMLPFSPLLYPYQLAMAQAAASTKGGPVAAAAANIVELQRQAADIQRQYLLDMIPAPNASRHSINNWKS